MDFDIDDLFPIGGVASFGGDTAKMTGNNNWLLCDGAEYATSDYAQLFAVVGNIYGGSGDKFKVPDYRGYVLRGASEGTGRDPDAAARTVIGSGTTGPQVGTAQAFATALPRDPAGNGFTAYFPKLPPGTFKTHGETNSEAIRPTGNDVIDTCTKGGDGDTRPVNVTVLYYIRAR